MEDKKRMVKTQVYLPESMHEALRVAAFKQRITMAEIVRRAVEKELRKGSKNGE